jgi:single-strand DNA-binding protein
MFGIEAACTGRLGRDPELRMVKGGTMPMVTIVVAVDEAPPKEGQDQKSTWVSVMLFGEKATAAAETLLKGDRCYVEGKLSLDSWTGKDGEARSGLSVLASLVQPMAKIGNRKTRQNGQSNGTSASQYQRAAAAQAPAGGRGRGDADPDMNQEIPF